MCTIEAYLSEISATGMAHVHGIELEHIGRGRGEDCVH